MLLPWRKKLKSIFIAPGICLTTPCATVEGMIAASTCPASTAWVAVESSS